MHQRAIVDSQALNVRFDASSLHKSPGERIERERKERERESEPRAHELDGTSNA